MTRQLSALIAMLVLLTGLFGLAGPVKADQPTQAGDFTCASVTGIPQAECEALAAFYRGTNGDSWRNRKGWLVKANLCHW
jgi:hypothetical protein